MRGMLVSLVVVAGIVMAGCCSQLGTCTGPGPCPVPSAKAGSTGGEVVPAPGVLTKDIHFAFDSYELTPAAKSILEAWVEYLQDHPCEKLLIEGHCDERGSTQYNMALGEKRANAAKAYLVSRGIDAERISTVSYGEERPLCTEHNEACWAQNRRDHLEAIKK